MATTLKEMSRLSNAGTAHPAVGSLHLSNRALIATGAGLVLFGLARRSRTGAALAGLGAAAIAYTACRKRTDAADRLRQQVINAPRRYNRENPGDIGDFDQHPRDSVDEASMESFPGSDPPAFTKSAV